MVRNEWQSDNLAKLLTRDNFLRQAFKLSKNSTDIYLFIYKYNMKTVKME